MAGEFDFIRWVRAQQSRSDFVPVPAGDDLAVLKWPADDLLLVGVDQVLDGVHFDSAAHSPRQIGRKVMNRNLSDCAAMACLPAAAVATVALPRGAGADYAKELYLGLREAADPFDCAIVGGDTASWAGRLVVTVTILGRGAGVPPVTRAGARPGDGVYVTGPLGGSLLRRHMTFTPRVALGRSLGTLAGHDGKPAVTAMIDLSDGLSRDLRHVCAESGVGAEIDAAAVPVHEDAKTLSARDGRDPLDHALNDGEDHELLFTAPESGALAHVPGLYRVGTVIEEPGVWVVTPAGRRARRGRVGALVVGRARPFADDAGRGVLGIRLRRATVACPIAIDLFLWVRRTLVARCPVPCSLLPPLPVLRGRAGVGVFRRPGHARVERLLREPAPTLTLPRSTGRGDRREWGPDNRTSQT